MEDPTLRFNAIIQKLRDNHFKVTAQRMAIIRVLAASNGHPSVERIYEQLQPEFPTMSLTTVYRTVQLIKSIGEVLELGFPDGSNRYDGNMPYPHPHVVCVQCKKIIDPSLPRLKDITAEVAGETGFEIVSHRVDFFGICPDCRGHSA